MVTMPERSGDDYELVLRNLLAGGRNWVSDQLRHDGTEVWAAMIGNHRRAEQEVGTRCRILMDLAGPKLRTGPIEPGPQVIKWAHPRTPSAMSSGLHVSAHFSRQPATSSRVDECLPVARGWLACLQVKRCQYEVF